MINMASVGLVLCLLSSLISEAKSQSKFVTVTCPKSPIVAEYGTSTLIDCVVKPSSQSSDAEIQIVTWKLNEDPVLTFNNKKVTAINPSFQFAKSSSWDPSNMNVSLLITKTNFSHAGKYVCDVMTDRGEDKSTVDLTVKSNYSKPVINSDPEKITPDKDFTLTCKAQGGFPKGDIRWVMDDVAYKVNPVVEAKKNGELFDLTSKLSVGPHSPYRQIVCEVYSAKGVKEGEETFDNIHLDSLTDHATKDPSFMKKIVAPVVVIGSLIVGLLLFLLICRRRRQKARRLSAAPLMYVPEAASPEEEMPL